MSTFTGITLIIFGLSFAYKCYQAVFAGRVTYWSGFIPMSILSPFFIHTPAGKNSLIKTTHGIWVHVLAGPIFFLTSLAMIASGLDRLGLPGTGAVNWVLTLGQANVPAAVSYDQVNGYKFPIAKTTGQALFKIMSTRVAGKSDLDKLERR